MSSSTQSVPLDPSIKRTGATSEEVVARFLTEQGRGGDVVLTAFNAIDPLKSMFSADTYVAYARKFCILAKANRESWRDTNHNELAGVLVSRTFSPEQLCRRFGDENPKIQELDVVAIAGAIVSGVETLKEEIEQLF
ncbi:MAG TPA: hypothetical protein VJH67_00965 [Candidatus Paceibacterota bacterium]